MEKIRVSKKLTLVFGLSWLQHDELEFSRHAQIQRWREEGYRYAAAYPHAGGQVYGLYKPADSKTKFEKDCISGAAVVATHPELAGKTGIVLIQFKEAEGGNTSVVFVGLRAGVVVMDHIIQPSEIADFRNQFLRHFLAAGEAPQTWGDISEPNRVDHAFTFEQLTPQKKGGGKACVLTELRSSRVRLLAVTVVSMGVASMVIYGIWQANIENAERIKKQLALSENTPPILYAKEIERWTARPVNLVIPSIEFLREQLLKFPVLHAGWILSSMSCFGPQCTTQWTRQTGTLEEFRASAPETWKSISPLGQDKINVLHDFKLPTAKIDRASWPKFNVLHDKLLSHWQFLSPSDWKAELGQVNQQAVPPYFNAEQLRAIANFPNAPLGFPVAVKSQPWWFANVDADSPVSSEKFSDQVELTEPLEIKYDGKNISFSFKGIAYVQN